MQFKFIAKNRSTTFIADQISTCVNSLQLIPEKPVNVARQKDGMSKSKQRLIHIAMIRVPTMPETLVNDSEGDINPKYDSAKIEVLQLELAHSVTP